MTSQRNSGAAAPTGINKPFWGFVSFVLIMGAGFYTLAGILGREYVFWPESLEVADPINTILVVVLFGAMVYFYALNLRWAAINFFQCFCRECEIAANILAIVIHFLALFLSIKIFEVHKFGADTAIAFSSIPFIFISLAIILGEHWKYKFG